jgi:hypothetical protein
MTMIRSTICAALLLVCGMSVHAQPTPTTTDKPPAGVLFTVRGILFNQDATRTILTSPILLKIGEQKNLWSMDVAGGEENVGSYSMQFYLTGKGSYSASLSMRRVDR